MADMAKLGEQAAQVLDFWLVQTPPEKRFAQDDALDAHIAQEFGPLHSQLSQDVPPHWKADGSSVLAAIIVLDQFSRNIYRDSGLAYAQDDAALALTRLALGKGMDAEMSSDERQFLYMPFMHSERLDEVTYSIELMQQANLDTAEDYARRHAEVIARFGRYPSRNAALGRSTTREEAAFLADHPLGF